MHSTRALSESTEGAGPAEQEVRARAQDGPTGRLLDAARVHSHLWRRAPSTISDPQQLVPGKQFISTVLAALETKTTMSGELARRYLQRAGMAGMIIGVQFATNFTVVAAFDAVPAGDATLRPWDACWAP